MSDIARILDHAAIRVVSTNPFFGSLLLQTERQITEETATADAGVVNGRMRIRYNPTFMATLAPKVVEAVMAHEVLHLALEHVSRLNGRHPKKWNYAADFVVNDTLVQAGFTLGHGWLHDVKYRDMSAEQVYAQLPDPKDDEEAPGTGDDLVPSDLQDQGAAREVIASAVASAAATARMSEQYGDLPANLRRMIDEVLHPRVDWRGVMRQFMTDVSRNDYSWRRPNRRHMAYGVYMPSMYSEACACVAVLVDTSGSERSDDIQRRFFSELHGVHREARPTKTLVASFDTCVHDEFEFGPDDVLPSKLELSGGGGTAFADALRWAKERGAVAAIVLTDLCGAFGGDPGLPVLWVSRSRGKTAPFGTVVEIAL